MNTQLIFDARLTSFRKHLATPLLVAFALISHASFSQTERSSVLNGQTPTATLSETAKLDPANPKKTGSAKSGWSKLTPHQQTALQPLARSWDSLNTGQQRKWLEVSRNYPTLSDADKANMHSRMAEWAALSNRERAEARLNFATTKELSHELTAIEKKAKWDAYQSLSAEEKKKLADMGSRPPTGAATATQPVAQKKLAILPTVPVSVTTKQPRISAVSPAGSDNSTTTDH